MSLLKLAVATGAAYGLYRYFNQRPQMQRAGIAGGESTPEVADIGNSGRASMRSPSLKRDKVDPSNQGSDAIGQSAENTFT